MNGLDKAWKSPPPMLSGTPKWIKDVDIVYFLMVGWLDEKAWDSEGYNQVMWVNHKWLVFGQLLWRWKDGGVALYFQNVCWSRPQTAVRLMHSTHKHLFCSYYLLFQWQSVAPNYRISKRYITLLCCSCGFLLWWGLKAERKLFFFVKVEHCCACWKFRYCNSSFP